MPDALVPSRLTAARMRRMMTMSELAAKSGVALNKLSRIERGEATKMDVDVERRIAASLGVPDSFLRLPPVEIPAETALSFRRLSRMKAAQRDAVRSSVVYAEAFEAWLEDRIESPNYDLPDYSTDQVTPEAAADRLRREWNIADGPIDNVVAVMESHGVRVFGLQRLGREVSGVSIVRNRLALVFLEVDARPSEFTRFSAAHELAHLVLHQATQGLKRQDEHDAEAFAAALLMPAAPFRESLPGHLTVEAAIDLKDHWKVPGLAIVRRAREVGAIEQWRYMMLCEDFARRGWRWDEPSPQPPFLSRRLSEAFELLREDGIGVDEIAAALSWSTDDLRGILGGLLIC